MSYSIDEMCKLYAFLTGLVKDDNTSGRYYGAKVITQEDIYEFSALIRDIINKNTIIIDVDKMAKDIRVSEYVSPPEMITRKSYRYEMKLDRVIDNIAIRHLGTFEVEDFMKLFDEEAKKRNDI